MKGLKIGPISLDELIERCMIIEQEGYRVAYGIIIAAHVGRVVVLPPDGDHKLCYYCHYETPGRVVRQDPVTGEVTGVDVMCQLCYDLGPGQDYVASAAKRRGTSADALRRTVEAAADARESIFGKAIAAVRPRLPRIPPGFVPLEERQAEPEPVAVEVPPNVAQDEQPTEEPFKDVLKELEGLIAWSKGRRPRRTGTSA